MTRALRAQAAATLIATLAAPAAWAQTYQQNITTTVGSLSVPFSPTNPGANINNANPVENAAYFGNADATTTITSGVKPVATFFSPAGNKAVIVTIPSLGLSQTFSGGSNRAANYAQALIYAESHAPALFVTAPAASSPTNPTNPVAGNPLSLVPQMANRTFRVDTGIGTFAPDLPANLTRVPAAITAGGELTYGEASGTGLWSLTVPLAYKYYFPDPNYSVTVDVPLTFLRIGNANVGLGSAGATLKLPLRENWSLGLGARVGAVGSEALRVGATSYSTSISSQYTLYAGDNKIVIGNSVGYLHTSGFRIDGGDSGPTLSNVPIANGVSLESSLPFTLFDRPASYEAYVIDTYFAGRPIAVRHYDEIGINIGTRSVIGEQAWNQARFGIAYTVGKSFNAGSLRFSYRF